MIEVKVNGPKRQKIIEILRKQSKADQNSLQMIRLNPDKLQNLQVKKGIKISFPNGTKQMRKNDYPRPLSLSLANRIAQKSVLPEIQSNNLSRVEAQIVDKKFTDKKMPQRKVKSHLEIMRPLHRSQELMKNISDSKKSPNFKVVTVLTNNMKRHLSIDSKKKSKSVQKTSKSLLFLITSHEEKAQSFKLPKNLQIQKQKIRYQTIDKTHRKSKQNCVENQRDNRLSENLSQVLKIRNQSNQKLKNDILRRIRSKQSKLKIQKWDDSKLRINDSFLSKDDFTEEMLSDKHQFQKSFGPWRDSGFSFSKYQ